MFEIDENNLPIVRTRQALLILDFQNDFVSTGGILPVDQPADFVDRTLKLLPDFRATGNIIWIRSVFEASRPINEPVGESESVITDDELHPRDRGGDAHLRIQTRPPKSLLELHQRVAETNGTEQEQTMIPDEEEEEEGMEVEETYLTLRPKQLPQAVLPTSPGTNFSQAASMRIDGKRDLIFQKSWYSAFRDGSLVQILRAKFVTKLYLCGVLTNISVFATAMDAAQHGYSITIVEDCLGYRSKARHDEALRRLAEFAGCEIISSERLIGELQQKAQRHQAPRRSQNQRPQPKSKGSSSTGIENLMATLNLRPDGSSALSRHAVSTGQRQDDVAATETGDSPETREQSQPRPAEGEKKRERVKTKIKTRRRHSKSLPKESGEGITADKTESSAISATLLAATQALERLPNSFLSKHAQTISSPEASIPETSVIKQVTADPSSSDIDTTPESSAMPSAENGVNDQVVPISYCEGDTSVIYDLLDSKSADAIFDKLRDEIQWLKMSHQGGDVPRLVAVQGHVDENGSIPIYRHPADESPPLLPFSPTVDIIRKRVEEEAGHAVNHVLIQFYRDSNDHITEHSDKTLDIVRGTFICNVSLGAQRTMTFRTKKPIKGSEAAAAEEGKPRRVQRVPLPHNSMAKVGLVTNMRWLHAIRPDKRLTSEKSTEELAYKTGRISLTFRSIGTCLSKNQDKIWGQGAVSKTEDQARATINGNAKESERMIRAFGQENSSSEFDWEGVYGSGFDVLNLSNWPKLVLSGDSIEDLRVQITLAEYGIVWTGGKTASLNWKDRETSKHGIPPDPSSIKFTDNDAEQSTVVGDLAILLYLNSVYSAKPTASRPDLAKQFTRLQQAEELLKSWRNGPSDMTLFRKEIQCWESLVKESPFLAGQTVSVADFALWPVLEASKQEWENIEGLDSIVGYHNKMRDLESVVKVLGARDVATKAEKV